METEYTLKVKSYRMKVQQIQKVKDLARDRMMNESQIIRMLVDAAKMKDGSEYEPNAR